MAKHDQQSDASQESDDPVVDLEWDPPASEASEPQPDLDVSLVSDDERSNMRSNGDGFFETEVPNPRDDIEDRSSGRKRISLYCFSCHRQEGHFLIYQPSWLRAFLLGLSFGTIRWLGPYRCQCCGHVRWMSTDAANPRYHFRNRKYKNR